MVGEGDSGQPRPGRGRGRATRLMNVVMEGSGCGDGRGGDVVTPAFLAPNKSPNKSGVFSKLFR
jgi:hypothetical protein